MEIKLENLSQLVADSKNIIFSADAEDTLVNLLNIQKQVEDAINQAKKNIEEAALKLNPNFSSVQGDKVKVFYRSYGSKYKIDESLVDQIPAELYSVKKSYSANTKAIETFAETNKGLPIGIIEPDRPKTISISLKGEVHE